MGADSHALQDLKSLSITMFLLTTESFRVSRPPARFHNEEHVSASCRIKLNPSPGQPKKYARIIRLPETGIRSSGIPKAGKGLFLREKVRKGQVLALYRRKIISETMAKKLKAKVVLFYCFI